MGEAFTVPSTPEPALDVDVVDESPVVLVDDGVGPPESPRGPVPQAVRASPATSATRGIQWANTPPSTFPSANWFRVRATMSQPSTIAGVVRTAQNWIGGNDYNPCGATFVPPPPEEVGGLLEDLCALCNSEHLPPLIQAAVAHAQRKSSTTVAVDQLVDAGVLRPLSESKRNRAWEATGLLDLLSGLEAGR